MSLNKIASLFCLLFLGHLQAQTDNTIGLIHNEEASFNGYTLFSPSADTTSYLVDNCGRIVNTWKGTNRPGRTAHLREDGLLLRCEQISGVVNAQWGGGSGGKLMLMDWEGNIQWEYLYSSEVYFHHHEATTMPNGNILIFAWDVRDGFEAMANGRDPQFLNGEVWSEKVVELKPIGTDSAEVVWEWYLWDHLVQEFDEALLNYGVVKDHPELVDINFIDIEGAGPGGGSAELDWIHLNSLDYNAELDQIVLGSRNFSELWVIDHSTTTEEAAGSTGGNSGKGGDILYRWGNPIAYQRGTQADRQFFKQHNVRWVKNTETDEHQISVFNNGLFREPVEFSSVDVLDLPLNNDGYFIDDESPFLPAAANVFYGNADDQFIFSLRISSAQQLPNGNYLITVGQSGRIIEADQQGNVVWEYINPVGSFGPYNQGENPFGVSVFSSERYPEDFPGFDGIELSPSGVVEGNPSISGCQVFPEPVGIAEFDFNAQLYPVPSEHFVNVQIDNDQVRKLEVLDLLGRVLITESIADFKKVNVSNLNTGLYFITVEGQALGSFIKL